LKLLNKYMAQILFLSLLFFPLVSFAEVQENPKAAFIVLPSDDIYADSARFYLNYFQKKLEKVLGTPLDTTVTVYLASTESEFLQDSGVTPPDWGAGLAILEQAKIVIKSPKYMQVGRSFGELIGHELAHIMLHRAVGERWLPRWMHEGFAMYISGEWHLGQDIIVARASWTGHLLHLEALETLSSFRGIPAQLAYSESYLAMAHFMKQADLFRLADLLQLYRQSGDFYSSWKNVVGVNYTAWISDWYNTTSRQYHFFIFLLDNEMFWIILALIFILLFIWKKRQNAKVRKRWEREERMNPPDESYKDYFDGYYDEENKT
jgi:hypothetical protein